MVAIKELLWQVFGIEVKVGGLGRWKFNGIWHETEKDWTKKSEIQNENERGRLRNQILSSKSS